MAQIEKSMQTQVKGYLGSHSMSQLELGPQRYPESYGPQVDFFKGNALLLIPNSEKAEIFTYKCNLRKFFLASLDPQLGPNAAKLSVYLNILLEMASIKKSLKNKNTGYLERHFKN